MKLGSCINLEELRSTPDSILRLDLLFYGSLTNGGWLGGAKVLGKLPVPGRPTSLDDSRARAYCACSRCGWGFVWTFFLSSIFSLFFLPLFGRRPDID